MALTAVVQGPDKPAVATVLLQRVSADPQPGFHIARAQRVSVEWGLAHRNSEDSEIPGVNELEGPDKNVPYFLDSRS